ncbi:MAG: hypothetical protein AABW88_02615 [Nanoarchaeota archaeon]
MKVVIDTKEDVHILKHIISMLHAISAQGSTKNYNSGFSGTDSLFDTSSSSQSSSVPETPSGIFNMFDTPSSSSSSGSPSIFDEPKKEDTSKTRDFIDSLQVY